MAKTSTRFKYLLVAIFCVITFIFVFTSVNSPSYEARADIVDDTYGTVVVNGEVDDYSVDAIDTGGSATLKAHYKDFGSGGATRVANAYVQRVITIDINNDDIISAALNGRMKAKVLLTGTNEFTLINGTEEISESIVYALSGGVAPISVNLAEHDSFTDYSISGENFMALNPVSGALSIKITATAIHHAETPGGGTGETVAETKLECELTAIKILFWFDDVKVSLTVTGNGKVTETVNGGDTIFTSSQPNLTYTFGEEIAFEGEGIDNTSFFRGFTVSGVIVKNLSVDLPKVHEVPANTNLSYAATFADFSISTNYSSFKHNAQAQGPKVTETNMIGFKAEHVYSGENALLEEYEESSLRPMDAGEYFYEFSVFFDINGEKGEQVGTFSMAFDIAKDMPKLVPNSTEYTLILGDAVADLFFSLSASHSLNNTPVSGAYSFIETPETEGGEITLATASQASVLDTTKLQGITSGKDLYFRFIPAQNFTLNYSISWGKVTLIVEDKITNNSVNIDDETRFVTITKSIVSSVDSGVLNNMGGQSIVNEAVKISLRTTFTDNSGRFFFIGLRLGEFISEGEYSYEYLTAGGTTFDPLGSGFSYDFYFPEWSSGQKQTRVKYSYASIQAVFVEDVSCEDNTLFKNYTGGSVIFSPAFNPANNSQYNFSWTTTQYYVDGSWVVNSPSAIGEYPVRYNITNSDSKVGSYPVVGLREMTLKIIPTTIKMTRRTAGYYNNTVEWGSALKYELSSQGTVSAAVTNYYYSTNYDSSNPSASTWTLINIAPINTSGCPVTYDFPAPTPVPGNVGGSYSRSYTFLAVGPGGENVNFGGVNYKLVSISQTSFYKIDTYVPSISNVQVGQYVDSVWVEYNGESTKEAVFFRATISYGGSGAQIIVLNGSKAELINTHLPDPNFNPTTNGDVTENRVVEFSLNLEYKGVVYLNIRNALISAGVTYKTGDPLSDCAFPVHIDFSPPVINLLSSTFFPNQNGWDNKKASFFYTVVDGGTSPSGVELTGYSCEGAALLNPSSEGSIYSRICEVQIDNEKTHYLSVTDNAGNVATIAIQANIDITELSFIADAESCYVSNTWCNSLVTIIGDVESGPSSVKYEYKVGEGAYLPWKVGEGYILPEYSSSTGAYLTSNSFVINPGEVGIDNTYTLRFSNMAGSVTTVVYNVKIDVHDPTVTMDTNLLPYQGSTFVMEEVLVSFRVADDSYLFNSGVIEVYIDDGGGKILLEPITEDPDLSFNFTVTKCTLHTIYVYDDAGNEGVYSFTLKVDLGTPNIVATFYVGGGDPDNPSESPLEGENALEFIYDYIDAFEYVTDPDAWIRVEFVITATASGTILQRSTNKNTWVSVSNTYVPDGQDVQQDYNIRLYFVQEQNTTYYFRLATGGSRFTYLTPLGGSDIGPPTGYQIRIDKTPPEFNQKFIVDRVEKDLTTQWTTSSATWKFSFFEDPIIGSGIRADSLVLYSFPYGMTDAAIRNEFLGGTITTGTKMTLPIPAQGEYTLTLSEDSYKYLLRVKDNAGHESIRVVFPMIDKTENFYVSSVSPSLKNLDGSNSSNVYSNAYWVLDGERVDFDIETGFNVQSGRTHLGPSGGGVEFSVDGGVVWQTLISIEGVAQEIELIQNNQYRLVAKECQYYQYKFRTFTGAGYHSIFEVAYWVKKDNVSPEIDLALTYTKGEIVDAPYDGSIWIDGTVNINIEVTLGASLGSIYYATTPLAGGELSEWQLFKEITREDVTYIPEEISYLYEGVIVINTTTSAKYYVKIITNRNPVESSIYIDATSDPEDVRVDRETILIEGRGYKVDDAAMLLSGDWSDKNFYLKVYPVSMGPSGIVKVYVSSLAGSIWSEYVEIGSNENASQLISHESYLIAQYRLKVINAAGKEGISDIYVANIDKHIPEFTRSIEASPLGSGTFASWYISNVGVIIQPSEHPQYGLDGYVASYYYREHIDGQGENEGWQGPIDMEVFSFILNADDVIGGNDYDFRFTVRGRSGIEASFITDYIPIDTTDYTFTLNLSVADVLDPMNDGVHTFAASTAGTSLTYKRGDNPQLGFECATSYWIKSVSEVWGEGPGTTLTEKSFEDQEVSFDKYYIMATNHLTWDVKLYRGLEFVYSYERQSKQQGSIVSIGYTPEDASFAGLFGAPTHQASPGIGQLGIDILYSLNGSVPSSTIPQVIGSYSVVVNIRNSQKDIYLTNPNTILNVVYFAGEGTRSNPYMVGNQTDFEMITQYMYFEDGFEIEDPLAYLGTNRRNAYFKQVNDFVVSRDMSPICNRGAGYVADFMGNYNGDAFSITIVDTINVNSSYALFAYIVSGTIENVGVYMSQKINDVAIARSIGFIAARIKDGNIKNSYAIGSVTLTGEDVVFGGIVGEGDNSLITQCFSDVNITITSATGRVGGVVGRLYNDSFCDAVYAAGIIKVLDSNLYTITSPEGALYVGSIAGHSNSLSVGVGPERDNLYIKNNLAVDGIPIEGLPMSNIESFLGLKMIGISGFEMLYSTSEVISISDKEETLSDLLKKTMKRKADALSVSGLGTPDSPYIIDNGNKFIMVERIPWAYFLQSSNISFGNSQRSYYCYDMPFTGIYDGDNFEIANIACSLEDIRYLGLFAIIKGTVKNLKLIGVDINVSSDSADLYVGGLSGLLLDNSILDKIVVSGGIKISSISGYIMAGGIVALANKATVTNCIGMASVNVLSSKHSVIAGLIAQVQDQSTISNMVAISTVTNNFTISGGTGRVLATVLSASAGVSYLYAVEDTCYANGKLVLGGGVAYSATTISVNSVTNYDAIAGATSTLAIGGTSVRSIVSSLFPFAAGNGTTEDPFQVSTYKELLNIGEYMFASFVLTENIIIGDLDGDGQLTGGDKYTFDFTSIGNGAAFTGYLDGTSQKMIDGQLKPVKHYIVGLNQPLFEINSGRIANIGLAIDYKLYASYDYIPETEKYEINGKVYSPSKVATPGSDVYFGGVAKFNRGEGVLRNVTIEGSIMIDGPPLQKVVVGGLVGADYGGSIIANIVDIEMDIRGYIVEAGGIVGSVQEGDNALTYMDTQIIEGEIKVSAATSSVGVMIGVVKVVSEKPTPNIIPQLDIYINNAHIATPYIYGLRINGQ